MEKAGEGGVTHTSQRSLRARRPKAPAAPSIPMTRVGTVPRDASGPSRPPIIITKTAARRDVGVAATRPRRALIASLTDAIRDASAAGDVEAARVALEALNRLLAPSPGR